jgi:predicted RNase H-like HicB family nuclease
MRYTLVIEAPSNFAAYVPDLPGCIVTGASVQETETLIREAIALHLEGLKADGVPTPVPSSQVEYIDVHA